MKFVNIIFKILVFTSIFLGIQTYSHSKVLDFSKDAKNISNYFSGALAFNNYDYDVSKRYFDKFSKSEKPNKNFSSSLLQSLINLQKYKSPYRIYQGLPRFCFYN